MEEEQSSPKMKEQQSFLQNKEKELIEKALQKARFKFAFVCLHKLRQINPSEDFVFSPYGIYDVLLLIYFGSKGAVEELLKEILYLSNIYFSKDKLIECYSIRKDIPQPRDNICGISSYDDDSNCWITNVHCLIITTLQRLFKDRLEIFDFRTDIIQLLQRVNDVVKNTARDTICHFKICDEIIRDIEIILTTTVHFKSQFTSFEVSTRHEPNVSSLSSVSNCSRRRQRNSFICNNLGIYMNEFPYKNDNTSLFVMLPLWYAISSGASDFIDPLQPKSSQTYKDICIEDISDMIERMSSKEGISWMGELLDGNVTKEDFHHLMINPIFDLEKELPIHQLLEALGAKELVQYTCMSNFIAEPNKNLHFGRSMHRTHVKVTTEETVAGAVTAIYTGISSRFFCRCQAEDNNVVNSVQPFVWLIYDKLRRRVLFVGTFNQPPKPRILPDKSLYIQRKYSKGIQI
ncbi:serine protease inhibitor 88Ea-like [Anoplolepis gracilipes]|uniref:serine protease inhibitor 88Ea-like n=1 Tax=Anoplolepis gracilipes TaxID=354296 RepID=UPI003BA00653